MKIYYVLLMCCPVLLFSQPKQVLYEVDGILVESVFYGELNDLNDSIVHSVQLIENPIVLNEMGYQQTERLTKIFTKAYVNRPDSIKQIPTTKQMEKKEANWYLLGKPQPYSGKFRDYYLTGKLQGKGKFIDGKLAGDRYLYYKNGTISEHMQYKNGFPEGKEIRYYPDGTVKQIGYYKNGFEVGEWKKFHPTGQLKQISYFDDEGNLNGEVKTYYSTGILKGTSTFKQGQRLEDNKTKKITDAYANGEKSFQRGNFEEAISFFSTCIKLKPNYNDAYFARGTAYLNNYDFEEALSDFNKAIKLEPLDAFSYSNRAFVRIRKAEVEDARKISSNKGVQVFGKTKMNISEADTQLICTDLQQAKQLGDESRLVIEALINYCYN